MSRGRQIVREWRILKLIEGSRWGMRATELYEALDREYSQRTIFRDLAHLQEAGFPLYQRHGRWKLLASDAGARSPLPGVELAITPDEYRALAAAARTLEPTAPTSVGKSLGSLRDKLRPLVLEGAAASP